MLSVTFQCESPLPGGPFTEESGGSHAVMADPLHLPPGCTLDLWAQPEGPLDSFMSLSRSLSPQTAQPGRTPRAALVGPNSFHFRRSRSAKDLILASLQNFKEAISDIHHFQTDINKLRILMIN